MPARSAHGAGRSTSVAVITRRGRATADTPSATVAGCPTPASSRHSSLSAVATRTWSWLSSPTTAATVAPRCRAANTSASSAIRSRTSSLRRGRHGAALPTSTQASSWRTPASRSNVAASSSGARPTSPRTVGRRPTATARRRSACTTTAPGGVGVLERADRRAAEPGDAAERDHAALAVPPRRRRPRCCRRPRTGRSRRPGRPRRRPPPRRGCRSGPRAPGRSTSAGRLRGPVGSRKVRTAADDADAASGPWPEPSHTISAEPRPCGRVA